MLLPKWFRVNLPSSIARGDFIWGLALLAFLCILTGGCGPRPPINGPTIEFTAIPPAAPGGPDKMATISGSVAGARPGQRIVLFARDGGWWVQPLVDKPFTDIQANSTWTNSTHLGTDYAAMLVEDGYQPPATIDALPREGGPIIAVKTVAGAGRPAARTLNFSGYEWEVRDVPSSRGGNNNYDAANAQTDANGLLHLRISQRSGQWTCAEVKLTRSLGYGSYVFVVRDASHFEPAVVASMFTWDDQGVDPNHREMSVELTRWGDAANKNAQYVVQPYYVPANVDRFMAPAGVLTHSFRWEPGRVAFRSVRGGANAGGSPVVAEHVFNSGVPSPGGESVHLNLYIFGSAESPLQNEAEVVIEKFQYLP